LAAVFTGEPPILVAIGYAIAGGILRLLATRWDLRDLRVQVVAAAVAETWVLAVAALGEGPSGASSLVRVGLRLSTTMLSLLGAAGFLRRLGHG